MSDTSTRSGMLWEVERILTECENKPQILLMENVPQVHSEDNLQDFNKWKDRLEELGYKNYFQDLIATDYGIPQTRNRCFMISLLGDYNYTFPKPIPLKLKLKDLLEDNVDEKYYLTDKMMEYIVSKDDKYKVNENKLVINREIACSKTTREGNTRADTTDYICDEFPDNFNIKNGCKQIYDLNYYNHEQSNRIYSTEYSSPTLRTKCDEAGTIKIEDNRKLLNIASDELIKTGKVKENDVLLTNYITRRIKEDDLIQNNNISPTLTTSATEIGICVGTKQAMYSAPNREHSLIIKNATKKGYLEATDGDEIDISSRMEHHRGTVQKGKTQTLTTMGGENNGVVIGTYQYAKSNTFMNGKERLQIGKEVSDTLQTTQKEGVVNSDLRIRKLTPRECFRLMGVKDEDFDKVRSNQSDSSLYHLAGDSIVVDILCYLFKELL